MQSRLEADRCEFGITQLCRWLGVPRQSVYSKTVNSPPCISEDFAVRVKLNVIKHQVIETVLGCSERIKTRCSAYFS